VCTQEFDYDTGTWRKKDCGDCGCSTSSVPHSWGHDSDGKLVCTSCGTGG
jgi:hypothetical protein